MAEEKKKGRHLKDVSVEVDPKKDNPPAIRGSDRKHEVGGLVTGRNGQTSGKHRKDPEDPDWDTDPPKKETVRWKKK